MKKLFVATLLLVSFFSGNFNGYAQRGPSVQIGVRIRPNTPDFRRPYPPSRNHVWVGDDWQWERGRYVFHAGGWMQPQIGWQYVPGYWQQSRWGWQWISGGWVRDRQPQGRGGYGRSRHHHW